MKIVLTLSLRAFGSSALLPYNKKELPLDALPKDNPVLYSCCNHYFCSSSAASISRQAIMNGAEPFGSSLRVGSLM
ncbi:hypothetical protein D3C71_2087490 [compost metagenome]